MALRNASVFIAFSAKSHFFSRRVIFIFFHFIFFILFFFILFFIFFILFFSFFFILFFSFYIFSAKSHFTKSHSSI